MREFFQSCTSLAFSLSLLTVELVDDIAFMEGRESRGAATRAVDAVSKATGDQLGPRLRSIFQSLDDIQRSMAGIMFDFSLAVARAGVNRLADGGHPDRHGPRYGINAGNSRGGYGRYPDYGDAGTQ